VDLGVNDGLEVRCGVSGGIQAEDFEAGACGGVVEDEEGSGGVVVFDSERVEVGCCGGEVDETDLLGYGVGRGVVVHVELALCFGRCEDALIGLLVKLHVVVKAVKMLYTISFELMEMEMECRHCTIGLYSRSMLRDSRRIDSGQ